MADSYAFGTKMKLLSFFLLVSLLPLILLGFASNSILKDYEEELSLDTVEGVVSAKADRIAEFFSGLKRSVDIAAGSDSIKWSVNSANQQTKDYLNGILSSQEAVDAIIIMDTNGNISESSVYASSENYSGFNADAVFDNIKYSKGISGFSEHSLNGGAENKFLVSQYIMGDDGKIAGYICFIVNSSYFASCLEDTDFGSSTRLYIADCSGNVMFSENDIYPIDNVHEIKGVKSVIEDGGKYGLSTPYMYEYDSKEMCLQSAVINNTKNTWGTSWSVVSASDMTVLVGKYKNITSSIRASIFAICVLDVVLIIIFVVLFIRPISNIMRILGTNEINISSQRILVNGSSELDALSRQINSLLDMLSESEQRYNYIVDMTDNIVFEYSIKKNTVTFSDNFNKKFSYRAASLKFEDSFLMNAAVYSDDKNAYDKFVAQVVEGHSVQDEFRFKTIYNDYVWYLMRCAPIRDSYNSIIKIVGIMINIDKTKSREQLLMDKASLDTLTQSYNRNSFELALQNEIELSQMRKGRDAVLFIDLDDFKHFNDEYSHTVGDEVLVYTVELAKKLVGKNGFVGRFGGDEFTICYRETEGCDASVLAQRIISGLAEGFDSDNVKEHITMCCSIGIAYITPADSEPSGLIDKADQAMYSVKKSGKSNFAVYRESVSV